MDDRSNDLFYFIEPFLLGLSCFMGGDQFSILLFNTNASVSNQFIVLSIVVFLTLIGCCLIESNDFVLFVIHINYFIFLIISIVYLNFEVKYSFVTTMLTFYLGFILTFLIVQSFAHYSNSRTKLFSFMYGLFFSRILPSFFWNFNDKDINYESRICSVSKILAIIRLLTCLISLIIKLSMGYFKITFSLYSDFDYTKILDSLMKNLNELWDHCTKFLLSPSSFYKESFPYILPFRSLIPFFAFVIYVSLFLTLSPTMDKSYYSYSNCLMSSLTMSKIVSHLIGGCIGIGYPPSVTGNSYLFYGVICIIYVIYIGVTILLYYFNDIFGFHSLYITVMMLSFILGYMWPICLGIFINTIFNKTCIHEDFSPIPCCGDKFNNECYCRQLEIAKIFNKHTVTHFYSRPICCKLQSKANLHYSPEADSAVLILLNKSNECSCPSGCSSVCQHCCTGVTSNCCLRLIGIYKLESVTTSTCENCQLTVRLDGICTTLSSTCSCGACPCTCSGGDGNNCCCICVKSCSTPCNGRDCCIKLCCCNSGCDKCKCDSSCTKGTRVFIGHKNGTSGCCCIKEIKPNVTTDFDGDLKNKNEFDIRDLFISDCCHVGLQVDLHCTMRNNFFRLSGINYPNKFTKSTSLVLKNTTQKCCIKAAKQCCCKYRELSKVCLTYEGMEQQTSCNSENSCSGSISNGCKSACKLPVDEKSSFHKRVDIIKVKLIVICSFIFLYVLFITSIITYVIRERNPPLIFNPNISFGNLRDKFKKIQFNSTDQITGRLSSLSESIKLDGETLTQKKNDLDGMLGIFKEVMSDKDYIKLSNAIDNQSSTFVSKTSNSEFRRLDVSLIKWSFCVGFMYKYSFMLFIHIQRFFSDWEKIWITEYKNFRNLVKPTLAKMSHKSKFSLTLLGTIKVSEDSFNSIGLSRLMSWKEVLEEMKVYSGLNEKELGFVGDKLALRLVNRMEHYVFRWSHRMCHLKHWTKIQTNIFDWSHFLNEYTKISKWFNDISPLLKSPPDDVTYPDKELNKGTEVFVNYKIK